MSRGFSLLELMLVIALMGILTTIGISSYRFRLQQRMVQKTSVQMQQILQAAMAYHVDEGEWPESMHERKFVDYLPQALVDGANPWQQPYRLMQHQGHRLGVSTVLPSKALAEQVAALLPNAVAEEQAEGVTVGSDVAVPGQSSAAHGGVQIIGMGLWPRVANQSTKQVSGLNCSGKLRMLPSLVGFNPKIEKLVGGDPIAHLVLRASCGISSCEVRVVNTEQITYNKPKSNGTVDISYLVLCDHGMAWRGN